MLIRSLLAHKFVTVGVAVTLGLGITGISVYAANSPSPNPKPSAAAPHTGKAAAHPKLAVLRRVARAAMIHLTATASGETATQVRADLKGGKSFDDILGSKASGVETQALGKLKTALDKRVAAGKLTQAKEDALMAKAKTALDKMMAAHHTAKPATGTAAPKA